MIPPDCLLDVLLMAAVGADQELKSSRLHKLFTAVIHGKRAIKNANDSKLFLEALCDQQDRVNCVERLLAAPQGLQALRISLRSDVSNTFINESSTNFLIYISDDDVKQLCNGQMLREILGAVLEPPTFWNAMAKCYDERTLSPSGIHAFACLLYELVSSPPALIQSNVDDVANKALAAGGLLDSSSPEVRSLGYKIQDAVRCRSSGGVEFGTIKAGGRHDNDFEDFRRIAIFPTTDEFSAKERPFYLQSDVVFETEAEKRTAVHLDNQFRLLREDMLGELRNDLQLVRGNKPGRRGALRLSSLVFHSIDCGTEPKFKSASIALRCYQGLPKLPGMTQDQRKKHYAENRTFLKHNSFGCLLCSFEIVAFVTLDRDEDLLSQEPPVILLRIFGEPALLKTLICLKTKHQQEFEFVQVDTPCFAYEPVLRCLQEKASLPLANELLGLAENRELVRAPIAPEHLVARIKEREGRNLRQLLNLPKDVTLDHSQTESLVAGLSQVVSLIQGPPGKTRHSGM